MLDCITCYVIMIPDELDGILYEENMMIHVLWLKDDNLMIAFVELW